MTPNLAPWTRRCRLGSLGAVFGLLVSLSQVHASPRHDRWAALNPTFVFVSGNTSLSRLWSVPANCIVVLREGSQRPVLLRIEGVVSVEGVAASASTGLIAASVYRESSVTGSPQRIWREVTVLDTTGREEASLKGAGFAKWSPDGTRLAVFYEMEREEDAEVVYSDSIGVWDSKTDLLRPWKGTWEAVGWLTSDVLVLSRFGNGDRLDLSTGNTSHNSRRGEFTSPDTTLGLAFNYERGPEVWDELSQRDLTDEIPKLLDGGDLRFTSNPFWVEGRDATHQLCFSSCRYPNSRSNPTQRGTVCSVYLIDPKEMKVIATFPGRCAGPTADNQAVVVLQGNGVTFVDLQSFLK